MSRYCQLSFENLYQRCVCSIFQVIIHTFMGLLVCQLTSMCTGKEILLHKDLLLGMPLVLVYASPQVILSCVSHVPLTSISWTPWRICFSNFI